MVVMKRLVSILSLCFSLIALAACSTNPATGRSSFTAFMSPEEEVRVGGQEHPKLVEQFGGEYPDRELDAYVRKVGLSLAQTTEMPDLDYSFTVLDDEMINAFALPGGYVHVTRGLLALASNEAEMAGVLAHELGHVTARHSAERYSQSVVAGFGATLLGIAGAAAGVPGVGDMAGYGAQAYLQSYSRDQELEADMLGIRYMTSAGYDPDAMASFFGKMDAFTQLQATIAGDPGAADRFSIMASHPRTGDRVAQAIRLAKVTPVAKPRVGSKTYLSHIDGLVYGDSPAQGVRRGRDFYHPGLRITFRVPPGFVMFNSPRRVVAKGPRKAVIAFDMESEATARSVSDMRNYVGTTWGGRLNLRRVEALDVNGMPAATAATRINTDDGAMDLRLVAIRERPERIYRMIFLTPPSLTGQLSTELQRTTYSFKRLTAAEARAIKPLRVDVITVRKGDSAEALAARMPFDSFRLERFLTLNGLRRGQTPPPGEKVKVIVE
jgi:predicted Zn-dependent protease